MFKTYLHQFKGLFTLCFDNLKKSKKWKREKRGKKENKQKGMEMQKRQKELYKKAWTNISNKNKN